MRITKNNFSVLGSFLFTSLVMAFFLTLRTINFPETFKGFMSALGLSMFVLSPLGILGIILLFYNE